MYVRFARKLSSLSAADAHLHADFVIVGAGTAGCLLANRLSAGNNTVILLEAGGSDINPLVSIPAGYLYSMKNRYTSWQYKTSTQPGLNNKVIDYPRGKVLGGCSSINGMIFMTGNKSDYDCWYEQYNNPGWSAAELEPLFSNFIQFNLDQLVPPTLWNKPFKSQPNNSQFLVENQRLHWQILDEFVNACSEKGIEFTSNFNSSLNESCGYFQVNQMNGWRVNSYKAFIKPIKHRIDKNLKIFKNHFAQSLIINDEMRVTGVRCQQSNGMSVTALAKKEVILCAGAINSPQILMLSGIGEAKHLYNLGIQPKVDIPEVGKHLQDHLQIRTVFELKPGTKTLNTEYHSLVGRLGIGIQYLWQQSGPLSMAPSQFGIFTRSNGYKTNNLQFHIQPLSLDTFGDPLHNFPGLTLSVCNLKPTSRGKVYLSSSEYDMPPVIDPNYLSTAGDKQVATESVKVARDFMTTKAMSQFDPVEYFPGVQVQSDKELIEAVGSISSSIFHPVGTCRMTDSRGGVVNSKLQVKGVHGLRVIDASIMPEITAGNTNTPTLLIAEKGAKMIVDLYKI